MRTRIALLAVGVVSAMGLFASSASAAGSFCYDVQVNAGGTSVVSQAGCQELPPA